MSKIVFLLYASRSGSTFLASLLDKTSHVAMSIEGPFLTRLVNDKAVIESDGDVEKLIRGALSDPRFEDWDADGERTHKALLALSRPAATESIVRAILSTYFAGSDADYFIIKGSGFEQCVPRLRKMFHEPKFIHIVRDPRGVYNSQSRSISSNTGTTMANDPITGTRRWLKLVRKLHTEKGDDFLEVRYEELLENVDEVMPRICGFLNSPGSCRPIYNAEKEGDGYYQRIPANQKRVHANVRKGKPLSTRSGAWRDELSETDIHLIQTVAGDEMRRLGYEPVEISPSARSPMRVFRRILSARLIATLHGLRRYAVYLVNPHLLRERIEEKRQQMR